MQMTRDIGPFHIIGIGGIGMSAIAEILLAKGYSVQGSDQKDSANVRRLRAKGVRVFVGHDAVNLVGARLVVISTAVKPNNPELEAARAKGDTLLRQMSQTVAAKQAFSYRTEQSVERIRGGGERVTDRFTRNTIVRRPNQLAFTDHGEDRDAAAWYDGRSSQKKPLSAPG